MNKLHFVRVILGLLLVPALTSEAMPLQLRVGALANAPTYWMQRKLVAGKFEQKLDHFNSEDSRRFAQQFSIYGDFTQGDASSAPVIYYFCGEWTCNEGQALSFVPMGVAYHAQVLGATIVVIEHRYYGASKPFAETSPDNMRYLTYEQALEDFAEFQRVAMEQYQLRGGWITIGGSYPGALSAFYRQRHPELVVGALSSSGVVRAEVALEDYDRKVAEGLGETCLAAVHTATQQMEAAIPDPVAIAKIKKLFDFSDAADPLDVLATTAYYADAAVQYGWDKSFCENILSVKDPLQGLAHAVTGTKMRLKDRPEGSDSISWLYQMCTQFGGFVVPYHDPAKRARSALLDFKYSSKYCQEHLGIAALPDIEKTNRDFYEPLLNPKTSRIIYVNGSKDPYSVLSISAANGNATNPNTEAHVLKNGAHCDDLSLSIAQPGAFAQLLTRFQWHFQSVARQWLSAKRH